MSEPLKPRTKLALVQNTVIGVPVIVVISIFNGVTASNQSPLLHLLGSAVFGYATSLVMLYLTLVAFRVRSSYDEAPGRREGSEGAGPPAVP